MSRWNAMRALCPRCNAAPMVATGRGGDEWVCSDQHCVLDHETRIDSYQAAAAAVEGNWDDEPSPLSLPWQRKAVRIVSLVQKDANETEVSPLPVDEGHRVTDWDVVEDDGFDLSIPCECKGCRTLMGHPVNVRKGFLMPATDLSDMAELLADMPSD